MTDPMGPQAVLRALSDAHAKNDLDAALKFIAAESLDQGVPATREDWRRKWEQMRAGCPDMKVVTEQSVEDGEWVAHRYTISGTQQAELFGRPPTGARFETMGMDMVRVRGGEIVEHWAIAAPIGGDSDS